MSIRDKDLIAMCDTPEIQDKWKPQEGDVVISFTSELVETSKDVFKKIRKAGKPLILHSPAEVLKRELCVFIPRIEDVLVWLDGQEFPIKMMHEGLWQIHFIQDHPIRAIIKAYMYLRYGKTWDGKSWQ
jgi:hypothetical protein